MPQTFMQYPGYWAGTILLAWCGRRIFEAPYAPRYIEDRTDNQKYALGVTIFVFILRMIYTVAWILAWKLKARFELINTVAVLALIVVVIILPNLPPLASLIYKFRIFAQGVAGFPQDRDLLMKNLTRPSPDERSNLNNDIGDSEQDSGGPLLSEVEEVLSHSCAGSFFEAIRIHSKIAELCSGAPACTRTAQISSSSPAWAHWRFRRYIERRESTFLRLENDYFNLLHRATRVIKLVREHPLSDRQLRQLSAFLADQAEEVVGRYQKLCAEIALSNFSSGENRRGFLDNLGYNSPDLPARSLWPIGAVLFVQLCTAALGFMLTTDVVNAPNLAQDAAIIVAQGFSMVTAVLCSVAPKTTWHWARPMFNRSAIAANLFFGLVTYVFAVLLFAIVLSGFNLAPQGGKISPVAMLVLAPGLFAVSNIILSWRSDVRILKGNYGYGMAAVGDALCMLIGTIAYTILFRGTMIFVFHVAWRDLPNIWLIWTILGASAIVVGYAIPGWAAGYIYPVADGLLPPFVEKRGSVRGFVEQKVNGQAVVENN